MIEAYARDNAEVAGINPAAIAFPALAAVATAIREGWVIQPKMSDSRWTEQPIVWIGISGLSGLKKSFAMSTAIVPLKALERGWREASAEAFAEYKDEKERHKQDMAAWRKAGCEGPSPEEPESPPESRLTVSDAAIERLLELARDNPSGLLLERDELMG